MGIWGIGKKERSHEKSLILNRKIEHLHATIQDSFFKVKDDIKTQKKWLDYLHNAHLEIKHSHKGHKETTQKDIDHVKSWVNHLYDSSKKQQQDMRELETELREGLGEYHKYLLALQEEVKHLKAQNKGFRDKLIVEVKERIEAEKKALVEAIKKELPKETPPPPEPEPIIQQAPPPPPEVKVINQTYLTNPEKKLLNFLFNQESPLTYEAIHQKTGHSINTVRVNMNNLKRKGLVEETTLPSGVKLFSISNKEKVKKIYNVEHL